MYTLIIMKISKLFSHEVLIFKVNWKFLQYFLCFYFFFKQSLQNNLFYVNIYLIKRKLREKFKFLTNLLPKVLMDDYKSEVRISKFKMAPSVISLD